MDSSVLSTGRQGILSNLSWGLFEKAVRLVFSLLVGVIVARSLGPASFGKLSYAMATTAITLACVEFGLEAVVRRRVLGENGQAVLASAFLLRAGAGLLGYAAIFALSLASPPEERSLLLVYGLAVASPAIAVPELWLQMTERLRLCSLAQVVGLGVGAGWRILLVLTNGPLVAYAFAYVAETMIGAALIVVFARRSGLRWPLTKASTEIVKSLLDSAWPLALASLAVILYMRLDAIMLRWISGEAEVGMYAAGIRFVEVWYFLPVLLCTTLLPRLLAAREQSSNQYDHVLQKLYNISTGSALSLALIVAGASSYIIRFAFGDRFQGAESVCFIYAWTLPLIALGTVRSQHLLNEGRNLFYLGATAAGLILNILLNLIFIRQWGATGAAAATLLSQLAATWLSSLWLEDDRKSFRMQAVALAFPFSYVWQRLSGRLVR